MQADGQTDMTKLTIVFLNFAKEPRIDHAIYLFNYIKWFFGFENSGLRNVTIYFTTD